MKTIKLDYAKVSRDIGRLRSAADACQNLANESRKELADLYNYWEGAAAGAFVLHYGNWQRSISAISKELSELCMIIQKAADEIREAEKRAASMLQGGGGINGG